MAEKLLFPQARVPLVGERREIDPAWLRQLRLLEEKIARLEAASDDHESRITALEPP